MPAGRRLADALRRVLFRSACVPECVDEHLQQPMVTVAGMVADLGRVAGAQRRNANITIAFCEPLRVARFIRGIATRSNVFYSAVNLLLGAFFAVMPRPSAERAYRAVILVELSDSEV